MKHYAIFYGEIHNKIYRFGDEILENYFFNRMFNPKVYDTTNRLSKEEFLRIEIDNPPIEIDEKVYIEEIDKTVTIKDRVRNAKGGYIYYTDYVIEVIEDEETEKTKLEAENSQKEYEFNKQERLKALKEKETEPVEHLKKWYQFWK